MFTFRSLVVLCFSPFWRQRRIHAFVHVLISAITSQSILLSRPGINHRIQVPSQEKWTFFTSSDCKASNVIVRKLPENQCLMLTNLMANKLIFLLFFPLARNLKGNNTTVGLIFDPYVKQPNITWTELCCFQTSSQLKQASTCVLVLLSVYVLWKTGAA